MNPTVTIENLKFPIGEFSSPSEISLQQIEHWISEIESFPLHLKTSISGISSEQLLWKYRPEGWSINQVIHHCADSHMNSFIRFKSALTEENPTIKPYEESKWAELPDVLNAPPETSIAILEGLHFRWVLLLKSLDSKQFKRTFFHPESKKNIRLDQAIANYAWHGNHHLAHIRQALKYQGEFNLSAS